MLILLFPFDLEDPNMKRGFEQGQSQEYQTIKPTSDTELVSLIWDFLKDDEERLAYNIGFLFGLYKQQETILTAQTE
jgi:hypothetical protein